jgi:hypothetical protein
MAHALQRDPRFDPHPGDSLEHPDTGNFRKVKSVADRRVYYVMIDAASRAFQRSVRIDIWRTKMRGATIVHVQEEPAVAERDPRIEPQPGDSLIEPTAGDYVRVRIVEMDRVYFIRIGGDGAQQRLSASLADWQRAMKDASLVFTQGIQQEQAP